jgi:hypothetical protein
MPKMPFAIVWLLIFVSAIPTLPPEAISGETVLDKVTEGLARFRRESDLEKRRAQLMQLAPIQDARVTVALVEAMLKADDLNWRMVLAYYIVTYHIPKVDWLPTKYDGVVRIWWEKNERNVRQRAKPLP